MFRNLLTSETITQSLNQPLVNQVTSKPASQQASKPVSQQASEPVNQLIRYLTR